MKIIMQSFDIDDRLTDFGYFLFHNKNNYYKTRWACTDWTSGIIDEELDKYFLPISIDELEYTIIEQENIFFNGS